MLKSVIGRGFPFIPVLGKGFVSVYSNHEKIAAMTGQEEKMDKGFTLIETLVAMIVMMLAVMFSARIMSFALNQLRQSGLRFHLMETSDYYKHYLSSLPFPAPELADGGHRRDSLKFAVTWQVEPAAAGLKRITLRVAGAHYSLPAVFYKSNFIQEVKND